jgi:hypothetical protein
MGIKLYKPRGLIQDKMLKTSIFNKARKPGKLIHHYLPPFQHPLLPVHPLKSVIGRTCIAARVLSGAYLTQQKPQTKGFTVQP